MGRFNGRHIRMIKTRYRATSTKNLLSLLDSVDTAKEAELISEELDRRGVAHD